MKLAAYIGGLLGLTLLIVLVLHADMPQTGHWESSRPLLNQLQHNIVWSQKGNFVAVPTDCPQRDERLVEARTHAACRPAPGARTTTGALRDPRRGSRGRSSSRRRSRASSGGR